MLGDQLLLAWPNQRDMHYHYSSCHRAPPSRSFSVVSLLPLTITAARFNTQRQHTPPLGRPFLWAHCHKDKGEKEEVSVNFPTVTLSQRISLRSFSSARHPGLSRSAVGLSEVRRSIYRSDSDSAGGKTEKVFTKWHTQRKPSLSANPGVQ